MSEIQTIENEVKSEVAKIETDAEQLWSKLEAWLQKHFYSQSLHVPVVARNELKQIAGEGTPGLLTKDTVPGYTEGQPITQSESAAVGASSDPKPVDTIESTGIADSVSGS